MSYHATRAKSNISISKTSQRFFEGGKDMSQRDGFASGFFAGAIFGSVVGGIVGALVSTRRDAEFLEEEQQQLNARPMEAKKASPNRRQMGSSEVESMETARRSLEDKIAQLNATIDEVREQLGNVNSVSTSPSSSERASL
jgi:predicted RNase H-like nuclease (RuvC/YqgF family)